MDKVNHKINYASVSTSYLATSCDETGRNNYRKNGEKRERASFTVRVPKAAAWADMRKAISLMDELRDEYGAEFLGRGRILGEGEFWGFVYIRAKYEPRARELADLMKKLYNCGERGTWSGERHASPTVRYAIKAREVKPGSCAKLERDPADGAVGANGDAKGEEASK